MDKADFIIIGLCIVVIFIFITGIIYLLGEGDIVDSYREKCGVLLETYNATKCEYIGPLFISGKPEYKLTFCKTVDSNIICRTEKVNLKENV